MDDNLLIAEFMGFTKFTRYHHLLNKEVIEWNYKNCKSPFYGTHNDGYLYLGCENLFKTSWDWIMPVVIACFDKSELVSADRISILNDTLLETNIDSLHTAVVNFIKEYNKKNENIS